MTKKLGVWLSGGAIHAMGDRYDGTIAAVEEQPVRNKWKMQTSMEDVLIFEDGKQLVVSHSMRLELIARFGSESDDWIGQSISLATQRAERKGQVIWERVLLPSDTMPRQAGGPDESDEAIEFFDEPLERPAYPFRRRG
jgi:hypothetical protein